MKSKDDDHIPGVTPLGDPPPIPDPPFWRGPDGRGEYECSCKCPVRHNAGVHHCCPNRCCRRADFPPRLERNKDK